MMRARHGALGLVIALAAACGGAGDDAVVGDTAAAAPPPEEQAASGRSDSAADPVGTPASAPDSQSSGTPPAPAAPLPVPAAPIAGADTAVGIVSLLGTALDSRVVVRTAAGPIGVVGDMTPTIRRLQGLEVWIQGPLSLAMGRVIPPRQITVERFEVRAVNGVPAIDGALREDAGALSVVGARGQRTRLTSPPPALRELVGRRVWLTRTQDGAVASFGAID